MGPRGALIAACTCNAMGQLTVFTDQAAWTLAVNGVGFSAIEGTFDGVTILNMQPGMVYDVNGDFSITVEGALGSSGDAFIDGGVFHGEIFTATEHIAYRPDFRSNIVAFGQFYDGAASGSGIQIQTSLGTLDIFDDSGLDGFEDGFLGFLINDGSSITSVSNIGNDDMGGTAVGEICVATNAVYAFVPAPGGAALLSLGGLMAMRRLRRMCRDFILIHEAAGPEGSTVFAA